MQGPILVDLRRSAPSFLSKAGELCHGFTHGAVSLVPALPHIAVNLAAV